ncbi:hypothetical protein DXG01_011099 [Tephrocybe rancida]|nr:hypothetical protein DXG01_011099 [Tephrocybe rancida]
MAASLTALPLSILQNIAFILASIHFPRPPRDLTSLVSTCSNIHNALSLRFCPQLYARIFRATFDYDISLHTHLPDSALAVELCRRHRVLWRTHQMDISSDLGPEELWAAMRLVLEDNGRNKQLLSLHGFSKFMMSFVLQRLRCAGAANLLPLSDNNTTSLMMWLLCLTLSHQDIVDTPEETRNALHMLLRFPTAYTDFLPLNPLQMAQGQPTAGPFTDIDREVLLEQATPIIILIFALNEVVPIKIPSHVPATRAIAIATQRTGPTMEDFHSLSRGRTPLFTETDGHSTGTNPAASMSNPVHLDLYKSRLIPFLHSTYVDFKYTPGYVYVPGFLSGLWEGSFMVKSNSFGYEKYTAGQGAYEPRSPSDALDVILLGETLPDHEQAWGGFKFAGRMRPDGYMIMCREPKNPTDGEGHGIWIFEGHLRYGVALVGQWRTSVSTATYDLRGIFSLRKSPVTSRE